MAGLTQTDRRTIQRFCDATQVVVDVVGSRASGMTGAESDYDYVIGGTARIRARARRELPRGRDGGELKASYQPGGIDVYNAASSPTDEARPFIRFMPMKAPRSDNDSGK